MKKLIVCLFVSVTAFAAVQIPTIDSTVSNNRGTPVTWGPTNASGQVAVTVDAMPVNLLTSLSPAITGTPTINGQSIETQLTNKQPAFTTGPGVTNQANVVSANLAAGSNIAFTTNSNGQISIAATSGGATTNWAQGANLEVGLAHYRALIGQAQTNRVHIFCVGDSITDGYNAQPATGIGRLTNSFSAILRSRVQALYGGGGLGFIAPWRVGSAYEPFNYVYAGAWSIGTVGNYSGGPFNKGRYGTANALTITLTNVTCSSFEVHYTLCQFSGDSFVIKTNGTTAATVSQTAQTPPVQTSIVVDAVLSNGTIEVDAPGAGKYLMFNGISLYGSSVGVFVDNLGFNGAVASDAEKGMDTLTNLNTALSIVILDSNDYAGQTATNTYAGNITNIVTTANVTGSALVVNGLYRSGGFTIPQTNYFNIERDVALNLGAAVGSIYDRWNMPNNVVWFSSDSTHPNEPAHFDIAGYLYGLLTK